jgi:hypothetical protein
MSHPDPQRRFQNALDRARTEWAAADPRRAAALAGCNMNEQGVLVPFFGASHLVTHPAGEVWFLGAASTGKDQPGPQVATQSRPAHPSVAIALIHYLLKADGTPPADRWLAFRELPDGMFYAQAFAGHEEAILAERFGQDLAAFRAAGAALSGYPLDLADASVRFQALPRLALAVLLWEGDEEFPARARILFDAHAGHYLPTEDLSGLGDWLTHRLAR